MAEEKKAGVKEKSKGFFGEFKTFVSRGNVMDMAVGVIIGTAFTAIVNSLVSDIVMPIISLLVGGVNFNDLKIVIHEATEEAAESAICYGSFIQHIIDFLLIALVVFCVVKSINNMHKKEEEEAPAEEPAPEEPAEEILLLREIRDSLQK